MLTNDFLLLEINLYGCIIFAYNVGNFLLLAIFAHLRFYIVY